MDAGSSNYTLNYNGTSPSGFTNSSYFGMTDNCSLWLNFSNNPNLVVNNVTVIPSYQPNTMPALTAPSTSCF